MKLRVLICLFLLLIIISDVTIVAAHTYTPNFDYGFDNVYEWPIVFQGGPLTVINSVPPLTQGIGAIQITLGNRAEITIRENTNIHYVSGDVITLDVSANTSQTHLFFVSNTNTIGHISGIPSGRSTISFVVAGHGQHNFLGIHAWQNLGTGSIILDNLRINDIGGCLLPPPTPINSSHALNFTLAAAMAIPTMTIGVVDDIMLIVGKYINCGITKFAIRAVLSKYAAKGVAVTVAIAGISYLLAEFADEIYYSIFATIPEVHPGDTHFHENDLPEVMNIINSHFPTEPHLTNALEQAIRQHIDAHGYISIAEVMTIVRQKQEDIVTDIYKETPGFFPEEIVINKHQVPEIMELIDEYFPVEFPVKNIIEQAIYKEIYNDEFNEIPFSTIIEIIEQEQNIYIPEFPTETPQEQHEYIERLIDKVIYEDVFIPISATPFIFEGIPATPTVPRTPKRPKEKIHTFPFYSIFVDPLAGVIGITLAHLFTAMMIIGAIISIGAAWGSIGAIIAGFIGTITTAYFGLTSWLIPVFLIVVLIIYANIKIKTGVGKE